MSRIDSRPSKRELGEYVFFVDIELSNSSVATHIEFLKKLSTLCEHLVHFGTYPSTKINSI